MSIKKFYNYTVNREDSCHVDHDRVLKIINTIPDDVKSILDLGCGSGTILSKLYHTYNITGVDLSINSLIHLNLSDASLINAIAHQLPFKDRSFDLVICADVLEHIPDPFYKIVTSEISRVSKRYLLLNTPYRISIYGYLSKCGKCNSEFHPHGHVRTCDEHSLFEAFNKEWILVQKVFAGEKFEYRSDILSNIERRWGNSYVTDVNTICPFCNSKKLFLTEKDLRQRLISYFSFKCNKTLGNILERIPPYKNYRSELILLLAANISQRHETHTEPLF